MRENKFEAKRNDRRRYARAAAEWPLELRLADGPCKARLRDVSRAGVCFFLDRPIPEMTILELRLCMPQGEREDIRGFGTVVRCESIGPSMGPLIEHYEVAVFLHDMAEEDREALAAYVSKSPAAEASSRRETPS